MGHFAYARCVGVFGILVAAGAVVAGCSRTGQSTGVLPTVASVRPPESGRIYGDPESARASGPTLSMGERSAAMNAVAKEFAKLPHKNLEQDFETLAAFTSKVHGFAWAAVSPGTGISAAFTDGREFSFVANTMAVPSASPAAIEPLPDGGSGFPPAGSVAILVNTATGQGFRSAVGIAMGAAFHDTGYRNVLTQPASVDVIHSLHKLSILYLETHGGVFNGRGQPAYALATSTVAPDAKIEKAYASALKSNALGYQESFSVFGVHVLDWVKGPPTYFFTSKFLNKDLFSAGTPNVAIINACQSASAQPAVQAFIKKMQGLGVEYYMGWTKDTLIADLEESLGFLVDRALGEQRQTDLIKAGLFPPPGSPRQAAFPVAQVYQAMASIQHHDGLGSGSLLHSVEGFPSDLNKINLKLPPKNDKFSTFTIIARPSKSLVPLILAPRITWMYVAEPYTPGNETKNAVLNLTGDFGLRSGSVRIASTGKSSMKLPIVAWSAYSIGALVPSSGKGAYGTVTVYSPTGIASNGVPLTMWNGTIDVSNSMTLTAAYSAGESTLIPGSGTMSYAYALNYSVRADVHPLRLSVDATPVPQDFAVANFMSTSSGKVTAMTASFSGKSGGTTYTFSDGPPPALPLALRPDTAFHLEGNRYADYWFQLVPLWYGPYGVNSHQCTSGLNGRTGLPYCFFFNVMVDDAATCTSSPSSFGYCGAKSSSNSASLPQLAPVTTAEIVTMDPSSYRLTPKPAKASFPDVFSNFLKGSGTETIRYGFSSPQGPPSSKTPAVWPLLSSGSRN